MKRREEADSGLRAGFVHEDELKQMQQSAPPSEAKASETIDSDANKEVDPELMAKIEENKELEKQEMAKGPKVSVQGVSGKMITGVIRAVKKKNDPAKDEAEVDQAEVQEADAKAKEVETKVQDKKAEEEIISPITSEEEFPVIAEVKAELRSVEKTDPSEVVAVEVQQTEAGSEIESPALAKPKAAKEAKMQTVDLKEEASVKAEAKVSAKEPTEQKTSEQTASKTPAAKTSEVEKTKPAELDKQASDKKTPAKKTESKPKVKEDRPRVKEDQGIILSAQERLAKAGKEIIRPQSGNYLGRNADRVAATSDSRPGGRRDNRRDDKRFGRQDDRRHQRPTGTRENIFDKDKDEDETPIRSRSPKPKKRTETAMPDASIINAQKDSSRRNFREKNQRDKNDHRKTGSSWRSRQEIELDEEIARRGRRRRAKMQNQAPVKTQLTEVTLPAALTVKELAEILKKTSAEIITKLISFGVMATVNQEVDFDTAAIIASEFGIKAEQKIEVSEEDILFDDSEDDDQDLQARPPVVVVMGHVDHGKTSILDWIRNARVASGEAGGITQHIGAYMVDVDDRKITFLDTPGHEAFTTIRQRGAQITDIAVLVVAADDGVMPQTIEAINHAKAANTEIIVAINKIDRPTANIDRVKQELAQYEIMDADWGGTNTIVPVSAKTGENMDELLEMIILTADVMELKANPDRQAKGTVIESSLDRNRGAVATLLVQRGTLRQGDSVVVGTMMGNVRAMFDDMGNPIDEAGPSVPIEILGLPEAPQAGDIFYEVENERVARSLVERRQEEEREIELSRTNKLSLENLFEQMGSGETKDLNIIIKADVQGSIQALASSLEKLSNDEVRVHIIHGAVGAVTASDIRLADVSDAIIIGFNVRPPANVIDLAKDANVEIRLYRVIYEAIEDVENAMKGMLDPVFEEEVLGRAEVRETYKASGVGTIAGCYVTNGLIRRNAEVRLVRDGIVVHEGKLASLRRFQDDVREVQQGYECGLSIERFNDVKVGDEIECFHMKEVER